MREKIIYTRKNLQKISFFRFESYFVLLIYLLKKKKIIHALINITNVLRITSQSISHSIRRNIYTA